MSDVVSEWANSDLVSGIWEIGASGFVQDRSLITLFLTTERRSSSKVSHWITVSVCRICFMTNLGESSDSCINYCANENRSKMKS